MLKTLNLKVAAGIAAAALLLGGALLFGGPAVAAAASFFSGNVQTSAATSTPAYLTPGVATSTLVYNTLTNNSVATANPTSNTNPATKADKAYLSIGFTGSSTSAVLHIAYEYSTDGIDWYQSFLPQGGYSTTTQSQYPSINSINVPFASVAIGGSGAGQATDRFIVEVPVPTKDVRAVISITGANGAVWAQFVPSKTTQ